MKAILHELRRRKVTRTAIVYAVIAWAVIEAASVIFPALHLPEWTVTFVVVLALIGFPVTLVLAWIFDVTRSGLVRTPSGSKVPEGGNGTRAAGRWIDFVIIAALLGVIGWLGWDRIFDSRADPSWPLDSIAVLPFANLTGDPADEFFSDGLAEELLNSLVQVEGLKVAARTSSFQYKGTHADIREIASSLGVSSVLEGSVRRAGDRLRITAQLIRAEDGFHLWSESFDRQLEDIFAVQEEITLAIVDALRVRLGARGRERMTTRHTVDVLAFEANLRGRYEMHKRSPESLGRAVEEFRAAIARDPEYAPAYSGLSDTWILLASYGGISLREAIRQAEPMARRALNLDPELGEAHASWGLVLRSRREIAASIEPLHRAIELNPSYSPAYHWLALSHSDLGELRKAVEVLTRVVEVDPGYATGRRALLLVLRSAGLHTEADRLARRLERDNPNDALVLYGLSSDAQESGDLVRAVQLAARSVRLQPETAHIRVLLATLLLIAGDSERADEQFEQAARDAPDADQVRVWPLRRAALLGELEAITPILEELLPYLPEGLERHSSACNFYLLASRIERALESCERLLDWIGWTPGEDLPVGHLENAGLAWVALRRAGRDDAAAALEGPIERELERLAAGGLDPERAEFLRSVMHLNRGDPEPFFSMLPAYYSRAALSWRQEAIDPFYEPVRNDPRFEQALDALRQRMETIRDEVQQIPMP